MMLMVVKIGRKLGLNTLRRCSKSWRISSHLKTDTCKVSSQSACFYLLILTFRLVGDILASYMLWFSLCILIVFWLFKWTLPWLFLYLLSICREPRGFGFVQYVDPADAAEAKYHMDGYVLLGRELTVVFAEENRKKPTEMRARERVRYFSSPYLQLYNLCMVNSHTSLLDIACWNFFCNLFMSYIGIDGHW